MTVESNEEQELNRKLDYIRSRLGAAVLYDQLAEECSELVQAALKQSRFIRQVNPTDIEQVDIVRNVDEEVGDVLLCLDVLGLKPDVRMGIAKLDRWVSRIEKHEAALKANAQEQMAQMMAEEPEPEGDGDANAGTDD